MQRVKANSVSLRKSSGGWQVILVEDGEEAIRDFFTEYFATNFAVRQMLRLNLDDVKMEVPEPLQGGRPYANNNGSEAR